MLRAYLADEPHLRQATLYIYRGDWALTTEGKWVEIIPGTIPPPECAWRFPIEAVKAIADAFHPHAGHEIETTRLVEALTVERERVDRILNRALDQC